MAVGRERVPVRLTRGSARYRNTILSADVIMTPRSGKSLKRTPIMAANLKEFEPPREAVEEAKCFFANAGLTVGPSSILGFSVSAPLSVFERVFAAKIEIGADGSARAKGRRGSGSPELPLNRLPATLGRSIYAITFAHAPQFWPRSRIRG